jgi:hypothetical protein
MPDETGAGRAAARRRDPLRHARRRPHALLGNGAYGQLGNGAIDRYWSEPVEIARWTRSDRIFAYGFEP